MTQKYLQNGSHAECSSCTLTFFIITGTAKQVKILKYPCTAPPCFRGESCIIDKSRDFMQRPNYIAVQK